jgi:hypothetical protein
VKEEEEILRRLRNVTETIERLRGEGYSWWEIQSLEAERRVLELFYYLLSRK